jgi:hypothetical protein
VPDDSRLSTESIEKEYQRLAELEDAAREGRRRMVGREQWWSKNLVGNNAALHIQRVARGVVGRRRAWLKMQLDGPPDASQETEGDGGDWVEIKDREKGEAWFYNKRSGISQWNRPFELLDSVAKIEASNSDTVSMSPRDAGKRSISFGQSVTTKLIDPTDLDELIAADATAGDAGDKVNPAVEQEAQKEIDHVLGTKNILKADCIMYPDGVFKPSIKRTVQDALLETRFDSVSHVLLDKGWIDTHKEGPYEHPGKPQRKRVPKLPGKDLVTAHNSPCLP